MFLRSFFHCFDASLTQLGYYLQKITDLETKIVTFWAVFQLFSENLFKSYHFTYILLYLRSSLNIRRLNLIFTHFTPKKHQVFVKNTLIFYQSANFVKFFFDQFKTDSLGIAVLKHFFHFAVKKHVKIYDLHLGVFLSDKQVTFYNKNYN